MIFLYIITQYSPFDINGKGVKNYIIKFCFIWLIRSSFWTCNLQSIKVLLIVSFYYILYIDQCAKCIACHSNYAQFSIGEIIIGILCWKTFLQLTLQTYKLGCQVFSKNRESSYYLLLFKFNAFDKIVDLLNLILRIFNSDLWLLQSCSEWLKLTHMAFDLCIKIR